MEKMEKSNKDKTHSKNNNNLKEQKMEKQSSLEPLEKQKKSGRSHKRTEREKQKAELERSGNELKKLLSQFGTKAKEADEIDKDTSTLRNNIFELMAKAKSKSFNPKHNAAPHQHESTSSTSLASLLFSNIWNSLMSLIALIVHPIQVLYQSYERLYCSINWYFFLTCILVLELSIVGLIWKFKRAQYPYMYIEPYEAVVHGTYGVETTSWTYLSSTIDIIIDFFSEVKHGGRSFSSPNYDGFVPI